MENQPFIEEHREASFNGKKFIGQVIDYWYLYVMCVAIAIGVAWFKVHYATPMYRVNAQVLIKDDKSGAAQGLSGTADGMAFSSLFNMKNNVYNELAILQTMDLYKEVVDELNLNISYYHQGNVRAVELYKSNPVNVFYRSTDKIVYPSSFTINFKKDNTFTLHFGDSTISWHYNDSLRIGKNIYFFTRTENPVSYSSSYTVAISNPDYATASLASNLSVKLMDVKATVINLSYNTNLPNKGMEVLTSLMNAYILRDLNEKNKISDSTLQFINSRIALVGVDLSDIESDIQQFKQKNRIADFSAQSQQLIQNSSSYFQQANDLQVKLQVVQTMINYLKQQPNNKRPVPSLVSDDPTFLALVDKYNTLQVQRDRLLLSVKENNPFVANLDTQIENLRSDMLKSLQSQQESLNIANRQLKAQNSQVESLISSVPQKERQFLDISRQQEIKQALYSFLLQKKEETAISKASNVSNATIIQSARADVLPYSPQKSTTLLLAILAGLALPTIFILLKSFLNNRIQSRDDLANATSVTIISEIGHSKAAGFISLKEEGRSLIAEQLRVFRTNLEFTNLEKKKSTILFTSSVSGEGKSFIVGNLGQIYAIAGKRVLLMEMDLRKPKLSKMFSISSSKGFTNFITSDIPISEFLVPISVQNNTMYLLPSGPIPPNPAELLLSGRMDNLMAELQSRFDIILIDTAPIGAVTDAVILGKYADVSMYVVRQGYTRINNLQILNEALHNAKLPAPYIVYNDVKLKASDRYGYGYGYTYGAYYGGYANGNGSANGGNNKKKLFSKLFK